MKELDKLFNYTFKYKGLLGLRLFLTVSKSLVNVIFALMLGSILDVFIEGNIDKFPKAILVGAIFVVLESILFLFDGKISAKYTKKTIDNMRTDIFNNIIDKDVSSFTSNNTGQYLSILNNDITIIKTDFMDKLFDLLFQGLCFITTLFLMISISPMVTGIILGMALINFLVTSIISVKVIKKKGQYSESLELLTKTTKDMFSGFEVIKNFNIFNKIKGIFEKKSQVVEENRRHCNVLINVIDTISLVCGTITFFTVLLICGLGVYRGTMTIGTVVVVTQLIDCVTNPIGQVISAANSIVSVREIAMKINRLLSNKVKDNEEKKSIEFDKDIAITDLNFAYDKNNYVLKNINLIFEKNKKYAIVGESGSGKSTLLKLLMRYYLDYEGNILVDGVNLKDIDDASFYKNFSIIQQSVFMFDDTVKENICLFNEISDDTLNRAIINAGLTKVITSLDNGIDTPIGENGERLSGGERQRVSIARALISEAKVMIFDEITSSLDNETSNEIENTLINLEDITLISITHKLSRALLEKYDSLIVIKNGQIVEIGSFKELIKSKGYFYNLYNIEAHNNIALEAVV